MAKLTLTDIVSGYDVITAYNANNALIEAAIENTLSRNGISPNTMSADIDLNSNSLLNVNDMNAGSITATSLVLNGTVITTQTTLAGGLVAASVSYNGGTLQDALDDDYIRDDVNGTIAGNLTLVDLTASGNIAVTGTAATGTLTVTGDITAVNATFSGTSSFTGDVTFGGDLTVGGVVQPSIPAQVAAHVRAGNTQIRDGSVNITTGNFSMKSLMSDGVPETFGPTGSGATNEWAALDVLPSNTKVVKLLLIMRVQRTNGDLNELNVRGGATGTGLRLAAVGHEWNDTSDAFDEAYLEVVVDVPCTSSQVFTLEYNLVGGGTAASLTANYFGFITD